jgi:RNA-binding protein YhbY
MTQSQIHLGKNGVTDQFLETLKGHFKNRDRVKISILKSATRDKNEIKKITEDILEALGKNYTAKKLGFTLFVRKWRRNMRD